METHDGHKKTYRRHNKEGFLYNTIRRFLKMPKKQRLVLVACVVAALAVIVIVISVLLRGGGQGEEATSYSFEIAISSGSVDPQADNKYDPSRYAITEADFPGALLTKTQDAGESYIEDTLFVGDSNTAGFNYFLTLQNVIGVPSMGIQSVQWEPCVYFYGYDNPVSIPQAVAMLKPRRIILNFGTNNTVGTPTDTFIATYLRAILAIEDAYPYCDIIVNSIVPIGTNRANKSITMQTVDDFNYALAQMCEDNGYYFLNSAETLKGSDGFIKKAYIGSDGIHLMSVGHQAIMTYARTHALQTADRRPNASNIPTRRPTPAVVSSEEESSSSSSSYSSSSDSSYASSSQAVSHTSSHISSSWASSVSHSSQSATSAPESNTPESNTPDSSVLPPSTPPESTAQDPTTTQPPEDPTTQDQTDPVSQPPVEPPASSEAAEEIPQATSPEEFTPVEP